MRGTESASPPENDSIIKRTPDGKGVSHNVPLALSTEEEKELAKIINQPNKLHSAWLALFADGFSGLEQVLCGLLRVCLEDIDGVDIVGSGFNICRSWMNDSGYHFENT
ncbi:hypothetical protein GB937_006112 [Aspergillus fischeri]|nr:hypothetical protein GB937_006112 [Aspergillus fischeri]